MAETYDFLKSYFDSNNGINYDFPVKDMGYLIKKEEIQKQQDQHQLMWSFGFWNVFRDGSIIFGNEIFDTEQVEDPGFLMEIMEKDHIDLNSFLPAYIFALKKIGIKKHYFDIEKKED